MSDRSAKPGGGPSPAQRLTGDFPPKMVESTDDVLFGEVWAGPELSARDRSLITGASLITSGSFEQLRSHLARGLDNGLTEQEIKAMIVHLAFYAGRPKAMSAIGVAKDVLAE